MELHGSEHHRHRAQSIIQWKGLDQLEEEVARGLYENVDYSNGSSWRMIACEVFYGYLWWTSFQVLTAHLAHSDIFVPSLSFLLFVLITLSFLLPCLLFKTRIFQAVLSYPAILLIVRLLSVLPIAYHWFPGPANRLAIMFVGGFAVVMAIIGNWWNMSCVDRHRKTYYHFYGLMLSVSLKLWSMSFNPLLTESNLNITGTLISIAAVGGLFVFDKRTPVLKAAEVIKMKELHNYQLTDVAMDRHVWVWLGVGFGCQMFLAQLLYTDADVLPRWSGITNTSLYSCLVVFSLCLGLYSGINKHIHLIASPQWIGIGIITCLVFFFATPIVYPFVASLALTVHVSGVWPLLCSRMMEPLSLPIAFTVYIFMVKLGCCYLLSWLLTQWFVLPAIVVQWMCLKKWLEFGIGTGRVEKPVTPRKKKTRDSHIVVLGQMVRRLSTVPEFEEEEEEDSGEDNDEERKMVHRERIKELLESEVAEMNMFDKKRMIHISMVLCMMALLGSAYCYSPMSHSNTSDYQVDGVINITALAFNAGYDTEGRYNVMRVTELIKESESSIVCLFDIDKEFIEGTAAVQTVGRNLAMSLHYTSQRTPRAAILTSYKVLSDELSDWDSVVLNVKTAATQPITVMCHADKPQVDEIIVHSPPLLVVSRDNASNEAVTFTTDKCSNCFVYMKGIDKVKESCSSLDSATKLAVRIVSNGLN